MRCVVVLLFYYELRYLYFLFEEWFGRVVFEVWLFIGRFRGMLCGGGVWGGLLFIFVFLILRSLAVSLGVVFRGEVEFE